MESLNEMKYVSITIGMPSSGIRRPQTITLSQIPPQTWDEAQMQVQTMLDVSTGQKVKVELGEQLIYLLNNMERKIILQILPDAKVCSITWNAKNEGEFAKQEASLALPILTDVNLRLANLKNTISCAKNKIVLYRDRGSNCNKTIMDAQVYSHIHSNFRRILQKESRFLRDELIRARKRLEQLQSKSNNRHDYRYQVKSDQTRMKYPDTRVIPHANSDSSVLCPFNLINIVS